MPQLSVIVPTFNEIGNVVEPRDQRRRGPRRDRLGDDLVDDDCPTARQTRYARWRRPTAGCTASSASGARPVVGPASRARSRRRRRWWPSSTPTCSTTSSCCRDTDAMVADPMLDVVVGSRWLSKAAASAVGTRHRCGGELARDAPVAHVPGADLHDPMSGFFMMRREVSSACLRAGVSGVGFKILLDLFATSPRLLRHLELPYQFRNRHAGRASSTRTSPGEYFIMLLTSSWAAWCRSAFIAFSLVGGLGLVVHLLVLTAMFKGAGTSFLWAQAGATMVAMTSNYVLNNVPHLPRPEAARLALRARLVLLRALPAASARWLTSASPTTCSTATPTGPGRRSPACSSARWELRGDGGLHLEDAQEAPRADATRR